MSQHWITEGFEEFRKGTFGNGGQNLYVSKAGVLQRIFQYDLSRNGYLDLVFANCQNHHESAESYVYNTQTGERVSLPGQGALCGMAVDLNGNGYQDLVVAGNYDMAAPFASTDIYFGSADGYSENRHIRIPTPFAEDCCWGHFSDSPKPTLAFALPNYHCVRLFYQSELGVEWARFLDLPIDASLVTAVDLDGDGFDELITRKKEGTETTVYWGGPQGIIPENCTVLPELPASECLQPEEEKTLQSDMEKKFEAPRLLEHLCWKGHHCFTLSTGKKVIFYTSDSSRQLKELFSLDVPMALSVATGDLTGNGYLDIAVASRVRNASDLHKQCSFVYLFDDKGFTKIELDTQQACQVTISGSHILFTQSSVGHFYTNNSLLFTVKNGQLEPNPRRFEGEDTRRGFLIQNPDMPLQVFLQNHYSRSSIGFDKTYIYWGGPQGYSPENRLEIPSWCAVDSLIADLDDDGWAELLIGNNSENSLHLDPGHFIHHFGPEGFQPDKTQALRTDLGWGVLAADFNHDGYLEIITPCNHWQDMRIFYGKEQFTRYEDISLQGLGSPRWPIAVDVNGNGWLDLIIPLITGDRSVILWGGPEGFSFERRQELAIYHGVSATAADLTHNGYPDLIIGSHTDTPAKGELKPHHPHHSYIHIYWNGPQGISESNKTILRSDAACSFAIADFNNDGWLDIFCGSYHGGKDRDVNSFLYWNRKGSFSEKDRQLLFTHSASGCIAADFNEDGYIDLAVANHKVDGDHQGFSTIWWNGPDGFNPQRVTNLPTNGPHGMIHVDPGNICTRGPEEYYVSAPWHIPSNGKIRQARVDADIPPKCSVILNVRQGKDEAELAQAPWQPTNDFALQKGALLQYRLELNAKLSLRTPRVTKVDIEMELEQ